MNSIILKSNCKVNIGLKILNERKDGYHNIHTLFQELNFHDVIVLKKQASGCDFSSNVNWLKNDNLNLCVSAWNKMRYVYDIGGISITLTKNIPAGKGLGGGSSNAATILKGLSKLYDLNISNQDLETVGLKLGADVPFFINGGTQIGDGIGELLTALETPFLGSYLLVMPDIQIDTSWAYGEIKKILDKPREAINFAGFIQNDNIHFNLFENDFEAIVVPTYPEIGYIKETLRALGARYAGLSGSGSTVFGIFDEDADAKMAESHFSSKYQTALSYPIK